MKRIGWSGHPPTDASVMMEEIQWLRPIAQGGCGHMWIVNGYDKSTDPDRLFFKKMDWARGREGLFAMRANSIHRASIR